MNQFHDQVKFSPHHITPNPSFVQPRQLGTGPGMSNFMPMSAGGLPPVTPGGPTPGTPVPPEGPKKPKKVQTVQKQLQSKLTSLSTKIGEIMQWQAKVKDSDKLLLVSIFFKQSCDFKTFSIEQIYMAQSAYNIQVSDPQRWFHFRAGCTLQVPLVLQS